MKTNTTIYATVHAKSLQPIFDRLDDEPRPYDMRIVKTTPGKWFISLTTQPENADYFRAILNNVEGGGDAK